MLKNLYNSSIHTAAQCDSAVKRLGYPENAGVISYLLRRVITLSETLKKATSVEDIHRIQGRIAEIEDLIRYISVLNGEKSS